MTRWARGLALLALLATPAAHGQRPGWQPFTRAFDAYAAGDSVVGASVLVMRAGRVLAHHEYGFADRALGRRVDERTIFQWGSITKTLTAVAVMQLRPETAHARRPRHALHPRAATGARPVRLH